MGKFPKEQQKIIDMADISLCKGHSCPLSLRCHRYTCKPGFYQSYADFNCVNGKCDYFWDNKNR